MKSFEQWKLEESNDPDWDQLRRVWGSGKKAVNPKFVTMFAPKVEKFKEMMLDQMQKQPGNERIQSFRDIPLSEKDMMAQSLVVAVLKAFYDIQGSGFDPLKRDQSVPLGHRMTPDHQMPAGGVPNNIANAAPQGWKG
jgi:hypothetical protein